MPEWLVAGGSGLLAGGALLVGSAIAWLVSVPTRVVAVFMAFGSGVLISALSFDLVLEAMDQGACWPPRRGSSPARSSTWASTCSCPAEVRDIASAPATSNPGTRTAAQRSPSAP